MRPYIDVWFAQLATLVATRSTCNRAHVGCVLARGNRLLAIGYNGALAGQPHCEDVGCRLGDNGGCNVTHAEHNALMWAHENRMQVRGSTAYVTLSPCKSCYYRLIDAGVSSIMYLERYRKADHLDASIAHHLSSDLHVGAQPGSAHR